MKILTSAHALDLSGTPTVTLTMYQELVRRGHQVTIYSPLGGKLESEMNTVKTLANAPVPDIILAQHIPCAIDLKNRFPNLPFVFYTHGFVQEIEQPPPVAVDYYLAINEETRDNFIAKGVPQDNISIVRDFIDTQRFRPTSTIRRKLQRVLFISNYKKWKNYQTIALACEKLGLQLTCCGSPYGRHYKIWQAINQADLVISWARGIMEAMACGRAALSFDRVAGDGYITPQTYFEARQDNFSGRLFQYAYTADTLASEMLKYNPDCGQANRELILKFHNVTTAVDEILTVLSRVYESHH